MEHSLPIDLFQNRNKTLNRAAQGIINARQAIDQLEHIILATVHGVFPDVHRTVDLTAALKRAHDDILVGIVESSIVGQEEGVEE